MIKTALISVADKNGVAEFAKGLSRIGVKLMSTGRTAELLRKNGVKVRLVSDVTRFGEMLDGRVKSLHPNIFGGLLAERDNKKHMAELRRHGMDSIDLVAVNFYPFEETIKKNVDLKEAIENIDIGGPSLVRAAAKNYKDVIVVVDSSDYAPVMEKLSKGSLSVKDRLDLSRKAFSCTARYDSIISSYLNSVAGDNFPETLNLTFKKVQKLRYGENPHQSASFYRDTFVGNSCVSTLRQLQGKELSFNNILDIDAAFELVKEFKQPTAAVIKHTNPCGVATAPTIGLAYKKALGADEKSAFGSIVALNRNCNLEVAELIRNFFVEVIICPKFENSALDALSLKKNLRLLETGPIQREKPGLDFKKVGGGILMQNDYYPEISLKKLNIVTRKKPGKKEIEDLIFAWKVNKHVKSNSVVFVRDKMTVGIGAGQMSRVDAVKLAIMKSEGKSGKSVMSSDAFFPFRDGVDEAAKAGVTAIIQPGGSIRDKEVIGAADEHGLVMAFTGIRLFKH